jgi:glycine cleavage system H protein
MAGEMRFAKTHEWIRPEADGLATVGISAHAVEALTDLVFMQLPAIGRRVKAGESFGEIESVKAVSDPYGAGWIARIRPDDPAEMAGLLDRAAYDSLVAGGGQH